ncbi:TetR/AcrR family transcriptional regulator [Cetobacterium sp. 2A]|uniref:TetR/AcrR family transcriptional regulator n=1 Tax=Cetobacterium sp. 2A TaxID=2754723 RepID=UPI00163C8179|nr:TetR/AcrR family transcriptional regulator [Cetobacterium sp. 2A]MBC2856549.1 TetR/AcrR family transcriptional regulator [Cetobacterium sp. 2A]
MKDTDKKNKILRAAKKHILQKGYCKASISEITESIGIAKGSFYTYYSSKDELLAEIIEETIGNREERFQKMIDKSETLEDAINGYLRQLFCIEAKRLENIIILLNLARNIDAIPQELKQRLMEFEKVDKKILKKILKKFSSEVGDLEEEDSDRIVIFINGGIRSFKRERIFYSKSADFFVKDIEEAQSRIDKIDFEKEIEIISLNIIRVLKGGRI